MLFSVAYCLENMLDFDIPGAFKVPERTNLVPVKTTRTAGQGVAHIDHNRILGEGCVTESRNGRTENGRGLRVHAGGEMKGS